MECINVFTATIRARMEGTVGNKTGNDKRKKTSETSKNIMERKFNWQYPLTVIKLRIFLDEMMMAH